MTDSDAPDAVKEYCNAFSLEGETALITGGGTGLGLGMAKCFVAAGARVILVGRRASVLKDACRSLGAQAQAVVADITDRSDRDGTIAEAIAASSPVSILVNNAGIHLKKTALETSSDELQQVLETHVCAAHALTRLVLPGMCQRRHGSVLFMSSMSALLGIPNIFAYSTAKSAYLGMVRALAAETAPDCVRVNAIAPGWIETPMLRQALDSDPARTRKILGRTPMERFGIPAEIGWTAVFLSSPAARFITGVVLPVDGGASIGF
jgi:NAD(P)-dependent dehydrogenase (short-subunit alcohol dehydrogenase family)